VEEVPVIAEVELAGPQSRQGEQERIRDGTAQLLTRTDKTVGIRIMPLVGSQRDSPTCEHNARRVMSSTVWTKGSAECGRIEWPFLSARAH
jgi:hypothetical protein